MSDVAETHEVNGNTLEIIWDQEGGEHANPRDGMNVGIMLATGHRNYVLGDEPYAKHTPGYAEAKAIITDLDENSEVLDGSAFIQRVKDELGATVVLPLWLLDHSGLSMRTGPFGEDPGNWDSGIVGFIFDTAHTRQECYGADTIVSTCPQCGRDVSLLQFDGHAGWYHADDQTLMHGGTTWTGSPDAGQLDLPNTHTEPSASPERIAQALKDEVATYDQYLQGDIYGYRLLDPDGAEIDSCWGFLGIEAAREQGMDIAEHTNAPSWVALVGQLSTGLSAFGPYTSRDAAVTKAGTGGAVLLLSPSDDVPSTDKPKLDTHADDLNTVGRLLLREATKRGQADQYRAFAERVNEDLYGNLPLVPDTDGQIA